jgi:anti-sigma factor RsiW
MIDARTIELINAEIDGELDISTRAELETALRTNPEARALHEDLVRMAAALEGMSPVSIPVQLHDTWPQRSPRRRRRAHPGQNACCAGAGPARFERIPTFLPPARISVIRATSSGSLPYRTIAAIWQHPPVSMRGEGHK